MSRGFLVVSHGDGSFRSCIVQNLAGAIKLRAGAASIVEWLKIHNRWGTP